MVCFVYDSKGSIELLGGTMKIQANSTKQWGERIRANAWRRQCRMTRREQAVRDAAYDSCNERAWQLADELLAEVDSGFGRRYKRFGLVRTIENLLGEGL